MIFFTQKATSNFMMLIKKIITLYEVPLFFTVEALKKKRRIIV